MNDYSDIDALLESRLVEYELTHPNCPECGTNMYMQEETYSVDDFHYSERWYECPKCGYCSKI